MNLNKIRFAIQYATVGLTCMEEFINLKSALILESGEKGLSAIEEKDKAGVQQVKNELYKSILSNRKIVNGVDSQEKVLPDYATRILNNTVFSNDATGAYINIGVSGVFDVIQHKCRGAIFDIKDMPVSPQVKFKVRDYMETYDEDGFSLAIISFDRTEGFAIMRKDSGKGEKGHKEVIVSFLNETGYYCDVVSKYKDIKPLMEKGNAVKSLDIYDLIEASKGINYLNENEDCSEVAERAIEHLGTGSPMTIIKVNEDGVILDFEAGELSGSGKFKYHVVALANNSFVIDPLYNEKVKSLSAYLDSLAHFNKETGTRMLVSYSDVSNEIIGKLSLSDWELIKLGFEVKGK